MLNEVYSRKPAAPVESQVLVVLSIGADKKIREAIIGLVAIDMVDLPSGPHPSLE
jgi:hypothetical protein